MKRSVLNTFCTLVAIGLAQTSHANLNIGGVDNATWPGGGHLNANAIYTSDSTDPTTVTVGDLQIGNSAGGALTVNSGTLNLVNTSSATIIGQTFGSGTITVNGGTLNMTSQSGDVFVGNYAANGAINMNGGQFNIYGSDIMLGRDYAGIGAITITGGTLSTTATSFSAGVGGSSANSGNSGILTFGLGNGVMDFADGLASYEFGTLGGANYINFLSGSGGMLIINGWTESQFETLVAAGDIRIDGATASASDFAYGTDGDGDGKYTLATVPEPSTLALAGCGVAALGALIRRRK